MFKKILLPISMVATFVGLSQYIAPSNVGAATTYTYFCHRSDSAINPYQMKKFSKKYTEVDGKKENGSPDSDHSSHTGDVFDAQVHNQQNRTWGDIIPPIPGVTTGMNWTAAGQAIYYSDGGCNDAYPENSNAELVYSVECNADNSAVIVTIDNIGGEEGYASINEEDGIDVPGFGSVERTVNLGTRVVIRFGDEEVYDQTPICEDGDNEDLENPEEPELPVGGRGSGAPTTPETVVPASVLPATSGVNYAATFSLVSGLMVAASVLGKKFYTKFF